MLLPSSFGSVFKGVRAHGSELCVHAHQSPSFISGNKGKNVSGDGFVWCFWGANTFLPQLKPPILLTAAPAADFSRIRHIPQVLVRHALSPVGKEALRGSKLNPRIEAEPHVFTCELSGFSG
jgi:hypothetical protein